MMYTFNDAKAPSTLTDFETLGVQYILQNPAPTGKESLVNDIDKQSEIGLSSPEFPQRLVDSARGASSETKQQIFDDLNAKWAAARRSSCSRWPRLRSGPTSPPRRNRRRCRSWRA